MVRSGHDESKQNRLPGAKEAAQCQANRQGTLRIIVADVPHGVKIRNRCTTRNTRKRGWNAPLSRGLQLDDSALQADRDRVGAVIGPEFGEDVLDVSLDGFLGDRELTSDLFVRISGGD
jgi:hypothetical protein